jgi:Protein of unknown function (DUF3306)
MSEPENFLARWSSRKLAKRTPPERPDVQHRPADATDAGDDGALAETRKDGDAPENQLLDPAQLPPLDSIGADTDITAFLRRDVPPELTRAALRRAWTSDPAIKNFVGLVENGWDFNDPSAMPGFGPISPEEVARLAGKVFDALPELAPEGEAKGASPSEQKSQLASTSAPAAGSLDAPKTAQPQRDIGNDAAQQNEADQARPRAANSNR